MDHELFTDLGVVTGIHLVTDAENHIRRLGQDKRDDDLGARLASIGGTRTSEPSSPVHADSDSQAREENLVRGRLRRCRRPSVA
ncbi:hypothetical protein [Streptomyces sp. NPDC001492]